MVHSLTWDIGKTAETAEVETAEVGTAEVETAETAETGEVVPKKRAKVYVHTPRTLTDLSNLIDSEEVGGGSAGRGAQEVR